MPAVDLNLQRSVLDIMSRKFGVLSLSEKPTQPLMWAHYAALHEGLLIEFDEKNTLFQGPEFFPVEYLTDRAIYDPSGQPDGEAVEVFSRRKSTHWAYERERRLIVRLELTKKVVVSKTKTIYLLPIDPILIRSVTLGLRTSATVSQEVTQLLTDAQFAHVKLFKIAAHDTEYKLLRNRIPRAVKSSRNSGGPMI